MLSDQGLVLVLKLDKDILTGTVGIVHALFHVSHLSDHIHSEVVKVLLGHLVRVMLNLSYHTLVP